MRKGQIKLIEKAMSMGFCEQAMDLVRDETKTLKELNTLLYRLYVFKEDIQQGISIRFYKRAG